MFVHRARWMSSYMEGSAIPHVLILPFPNLGIILSVSVRTVRRIVLHV